MYLDLCGLESGTVPSMLSDSGSDLAVSWGRTVPGGCRPRSKQVMGVHGASWEGRTVTAGTPRAQEVVRAPTAGYPRPETGAQEPSSGPGPALPLRAEYSVEGVGGLSGRKGGVGWDAGHPLGDQPLECI